MPTEVYLSNITFKSQKIDMIKRKQMGFQILNWPGLYAQSVAELRMKRDLFSWVKNIQMHFLKMFFIQKHESANEDDASTFHNSDL